MACTALTKEVQQKEQQFQDTQDEAEILQQEVEVIEK